MPSNRNPLPAALPGAGKLHADIATASAQLYAVGGGSEATLAFLMAVVQQEMAVVRKTAGIVDTGQASYNLRLSEADPIWVSDTPGTDLLELFIVVWETDDTPIKAAGVATTTVASLVGAAVGDGFSLASPLTLNFSAALPNSGGSFCIYYAARQQVATFANDSLSFPNIRQALSVNPVVQRVLEELHASVGSQAWDMPWDATIEALASAGMNERYNRQTGVALAAFGTLYTSGQVANADTVTIDGKVYTFETVLTNVNGHVNIGPTWSLSLENLRRAINLDGVSGVDYAALTTLHPTVRASNNNSAVFAWAKAGGTGGNAITTTEVSASLTWSGATLSGGADFNYDRPGEGAVIYRNGAAPTSHTTRQPLDFVNYSFIDPFWAQWRAEVPGPYVTAISDSHNEGGMGFVAISSMRHSQAADELVKDALSSGAFTTLYPRNIVADTLASENVRTRIDPTNYDATLNPAAGGTTAARSTIECGAGDFFWNASGNTEISVGYDLIKLSYPPPMNVERADQVYIIIARVSDTRVMVRTLSGGLPNFPSGLGFGGLGIQLIKMGMHQGGGATLLTDPGSSLAGDIALYHAVPPSVTDDPSSAFEIVPNAARFLAAARTDVEYSASGPPPAAIEWGGFNPQATVAQVYPGRLRGDGGVDATIVKNTTRAVAVSATGTTTWHPGLEGSILHVNFTHAAGTITWTLAMHADYDPVDGERLEIILRPAPNAPPTGTAEVTIVWPAGSPHTTYGFGTAAIIINEVSRLYLTHFSGGGFSGWLLSQSNLDNISYLQKVPYLKPWDLNGPIGTETGGGAITWRPMSEGGYITIKFGDALAYSFVVTGEGAVFPNGGYQIAIEIEQGPGGATMTWPADFEFSGLDATLPPNAGDRVLYRGLYSNRAVKWLMTRTDY